jgi:Zn-dependent M28 family amino/carboxypeptidase
MRLLLAGALATVTAAGLATIRPAVLTDEETSAARAIDAGRMRADIRFLSSDLLEGRAPGSREDRLAREYVSSRFEAIGLAPGAPDGSWEQVLGGHENEAGHRSSANVIGRLAGRDPELLREAVVYSAHFSRALDGAAGPAALLAVAEAFAALPVRPRRSILFALVADEEQGLPGATLLARTPPAPVERFVAHLDLDGAGIGGRPREVPVIGPRRSSLDGWIRTLAEAQDRTPEALPDGGACDSSSRVSFARTGVPTACVGAGTDVEDVQLAFFLGAKVAEAPLAPVWQPVDGLDGALLTADRRR